ncbi:Mu transposase C-terminal domain-containing protein [Ureibacillus sp. MALMAid1270]|uniref:Mu transposase C-terminal domain-containing protein n=1 Tax=Ureibacillus sp. MALMAid1270 TaxID=3411629 RepID=UPI003BA408DC
MQVNNLKINGEVTYYGLTYIILAIDPPIVTLKKKDTSVDAISINYFELITNPSFRAGKLLNKKIENDKTKYFSILDSINDKKREQVSERLKIIRPLLLLEKLKQEHFPSYVEFLENNSDLLNEKENPQKLTQELLIERLSKKYSLSARTIKRYLSKYRHAASANPQYGEEGLISNLGTGYHYRSDNKTLIISDPMNPDQILDQIQVRLDDVYIPIIKEVIENDFLTIHQKNKATIINNIEIKCFVNNITPPARITLYKILERISPKIIERMRFGRKGSAKYEDVNRGFANNEALYPLHLVEIDHTRMDIEVIDEKSGVVKGRPWITLGIDVYSRMVWCMYISFEPPSGNRVRKAIQHGILFKNTKDQYGTFNNWEIFGVPRSIQFDNGKEFHNTEIKRLVNDTIESNIRFRPIATPRYGGTIERLIGTFNTQVLHNLEGTTKSNIFQKGEYNSTENALLSLEDVKRILTRYITDIYHYQKHSGLPLDCNSPMARYYEGLKIAGLPDFIEPEEEEDYKVLLLPTMLKPYTKDGIRIDNRIYRSNAMSHLIDKREVKYLVKYDIDDISYVYIKPPNEERYVRVNIAFPTYDSVKGMNAYTFKLLMKHLRENGELKRNKLATDSQILQAKNELKKDIEKAYKTNLRTRQQLERIGWEVEVSTINQAELVDKRENTSTYQQLLANAIQKFNEDK